jgi:hypothetical protein
MKFVILILREYALMFIKELQADNTYLLETGF